MLAQLTLPASIHVRSALLNQNSEFVDCGGDTRNRFCKRLIAVN